MKLIKRNPDYGYIDTWLWVPKKYLNVDGTKNALSFVFYDSYDEHKERYVYLWKETDYHLLVPRAFWNPKDLSFPVYDLRPTSYPQVDIRSHIKLDHREQLTNGKVKLLPTGFDTQQQSLEAMLASPGGILQLACGKGKTCVALVLIATLGMPALVVVPDTQLLEQWKNEIDKLMIVPGGVGLIQADIFRWKNPIVLTTYKTIGARAPFLSEEILRWFGVIIWDEGHHIPAPTFAASAEAFYGRRYSLTATPQRDDGLHIISEFHIGPILYKDLTQELKPGIYFKWTGLELDETQPGVEVRDRNKEIHLGMLAGYFGKWAPRLKIILDDIQEAMNHGRKVLILSTSEGEIVNLAALWTFGWNASLYTDIPIPTPTEVGETAQPIDLTVKKRREFERYAAALEYRVIYQQLLLLPAVLADLQYQLTEIQRVLHQNMVHRKIMAELVRRQRAYIKNLLEHVTTCGFLVYKVPAKIRHKFVDKMPIVFAQMKYGKEGLDSQILDTILVSTPFSSRNGLQQVMGRVCRTHRDKKTPLVMFYEDNIGLLIGMHQKLRKHLRDWPHEEGGPFEYVLIDHPKRARTQWNQQTMTSILGS